MSKKIQSKKAIFITTAAFLFAITAIYFGSSKYRPGTGVDHPAPPQAPAESLEGREENKETQVSKSLFSTKAPSVPVVISNSEEASTENSTEPDAIEVAASEPQKIEVIGHAELSKAYLNQTSSVSRLMTKFLQKADYTKELNSIDQTKLPPEIKKILAEMKEFAENNMQAQDVNTKVFPKEGVLDKIVGHFMQIEKIPGSQLKNQQHEQISKRLHILEDYFYSQKFLNEMMNYD